MPEPGLSRRTVTTTPDNFSQTTDSFLDGRTASTYGDLQPDQVYTYSVNSIGEVSTRAFLDGATLREATSTQSDWAGRSVRIDYADGNFATMTYNALGQRSASTDPDGVTTLYAYNARGQQTLSATDLDANGSIDFGTDSIQFSDE